MATEKRLIDANELLHNQVWLCGGFVGDPYCDGYMEALDKVETVIREFPTVEAVEVVRCKDCLHYHGVTGKDSGKPCGYGWCEHRNGTKRVCYDEEFCSCGERKEQ